MKKSAFCISIAFCLLLVGGLGNIVAQTFDISSGGTPTITGALSGSVTGSSNVNNNLAVTINFGEVSPANTNTIVKVVVPIAIRSSARYQVAAAVTGLTGGDTQAVQRSDIGFGARNIRSMGANARVCTISNHVFRTPVNNDPASGVTVDAAGRATYTSTLNNVGVSTVILNGPRLSNDTSPVRQTNNGYIFDAIFVITPQFYEAGTRTATITFTISLGPAANC